MYIKPRNLPPYLQLSDVQLKQMIADKVGIISDYFAHSGFSKAVIGLSGGIDSAVSLALAARALRPEKIMCLRIPCGMKRKASFHRAAKIADSCGVLSKQLRTVDITALETEFWAATIPCNGIRHNGLRRGNIAARLRMIALMDACTAWDSLLIGTENLSEHHLGYFTIGGDAVSNYEPIRNLWKVQVYQLGAALGLPDSVLDCAPSAELWDGQTDEDEFGASYTVIDTVLAGVLEQCLSKTEIIRKYGVKNKDYDRVMLRYKRMKGKVNSPFISPK